MARQKFTEDFKKTIVNLSTGGSTVEELSKEYGLHPQTIYKWKKLYTPNSESGVTEAEFLGLQKKLAKLEEDNKILKKALTIFAQK